jgi:hypothetical protein
MLLSSLGSSYGSMRKLRFKNMRQSTSSMSMKERREDIHLSKRAINHKWGQEEAN